MAVLYSLNLCFAFYCLSGSAKTEGGLRAQSRTWYSLVNYTQFCGSEFVQPARTKCDAWLLRDGSGFSEIIRQLNNKALESTIGSFRLKVLNWFWRSWLKKRELYFLFWSGFNLGNAPTKYSYLWHLLKAYIANLTKKNLMELYWKFSIKLMFQA